jgi:catechol-2,3-dioxygenase
MDISHLHLHVRDRGRATEFYRRWFGLAVWIDGDGVTFLRGTDDFLLALMHDADPAPVPPWFHFGMRLPTAAALHDLLDRMQVAQVPIVKPLYEDAVFASFRCGDPDGYAIELYWEDRTGR